ncbi:MAG: uncharacterized protein JWM52_570 [Candidatus Saccharibacteria bacterium]|nr:uncharacterized protein [Candidatus Saccharibacteria bacterium]
MEPSKKISPAIIAVIVIVLIGIVVTTVIILNNQSNTPLTTGTTSTRTNGTYKDGTYAATGAYSTPGGRESIEVTVTLAGNIITSTTLKSNAISGEAKEYQADFASGYKSLVVGKNIDEVSLSRVAGSSLTSNGFNTALEQIKTDASS